MTHADLPDSLDGLDGLDGPDGLDGDRTVHFADDDPVLPASTRDDTDEGWGEPSRRNDERLLEERPPHW